MIRCVIDTCIHRHSYVLVMSNLLHGISPRQVRISQRCIHAQIHACILKFIYIYIYIYIHTYVSAYSYAIVMSSLVGESLACGNLGIIGSQKGDVKTAKACMERHLKLATALKVFMCACVCACPHMIFRQQMHACMAT